MSIPESFGELDHEPSSLGSTRFARELNNIIKALKEAGTEEHVLLPKIAVIGNQSSGKSSLIEAICQIQVPRASGTCTRCPMEVSLHTSDNGQWQGKIYLRREINQASRPVSALVQPFVKLRRKEDVPGALRRAQLAILNPSKSHNDFINLSDSRCESFQSELPFSRDAVVLDITGANVDVTFIDLPGLISNEDPTIVKMISELVCSYAMQPDCVLLTVISMRDDIQNQAATQIARRFDPERLRTIGVLTKADTVEGAEMDKWLKIAKNEEHTLRHGYYVTRLSTSDELLQNPSWSDVLQREHQFFIEQKRWSSSRKIRCGTETLTMALSEKLANMIQDCLPKIRQTLNAQLRDVLNELKALPQTLEDDPQPKLLALCSDFEYLINQFVDANGNRKDYYMQMKPHFRHLKELIDATKPTVQTNKDSHNDADLSIEKVRSLIEATKIKELHGEVPDLVYHTLIGKYVENRWPHICQNWFSEFEKFSSSFIGWCCNHFFKNLRTADLRAEVLKVTGEVLQQVGDTTREHIQLFCKMEIRRSFRLNEEDYCVRFESEQSELRKALQLEGSQSETELRIISNVLTYFDIASKRLIEAVPMICEISFAQRLGEIIRKDLTKLLGLTGSNGLENCAKFAREEFSVRNERQRLGRAQEVLESSLKVLDRFGS